MRLAGIIVLAGVSAAPLSATAATSAQERPERQVVCQGHASGERGEDVSVSINVEPDGTRVGTSSSWSPPLLARIGGAALDQPDLQLVLLYSDSSALSIGKPAGAFISVSLFSPPRKPISETKLNARLDSLLSSISFDGAPAQSLKYDPPNSLMMTIPGTAFRSVTLDLPAPLPGEATVSLADRKGKPVLSHRYTTRDTASRDALYTQAWQQATAAAANLSSCDLTAEGPL